MGTLEKNLHLKDGRGWRKEVVESGCDSYNSSLKVVFTDTKGKEASPQISRNNSKIRKATSTKKTYI